MNNKNKEIKGKETKICRECHNFKPLSDFGNRTQSKDGKMIYCKLCASIINKVSYYNNLDTRSKYLKNKKIISETFHSLSVLIPSKIKICSSCRIEKDIDDFCCSKLEKDGYYYQCKLCQKEYRLKNKDKLIQKRKDNKDKIKEYSINYNSNPENKQKRKKNKKKSLFVKKTPQEIRDRKNKYSVDEYKNNPQYKLKKLIRSRLYKALKFNKKHKNTIELLGCTIEEYKYYIDMQFLPEMNWSNHGVIWHIDHIKPCSKFNLELESEQIKCFNYCNTEPVFITSEIAESLGYDNYLGNLNKYNKYNEDL